MNMNVVLLSDATVKHNITQKVTNGSQSQLHVTS